MAKRLRKSRKSPANLNKRDSLTKLEQLPNVGPKIGRTLRRLGVNVPQDLCGRDAYQMYQELCRLSGKRYDVCVLDVFISAVQFMDGGPAKPWWKFTAQRKRRLKACGIEI
ncbi:MAG: helix-hairpin-helix domain-containing protein [Thermoguttaceae bacterium]|jgi:hypothetical protein